MFNSTLVALVYFIAVIGVMCLIYRKQTHNTKSISLNTKRLDEIEPVVKSLVSKIEEAVK